MRSVSIIIPVCNGGEDFRRCLSVIARAEPPPLELIVVDDGSTDSSGQIAREYGAAVYRIEGPQGPAKARNAGIKHAQGEIVFFTDADVLVPADVISQIEKSFRDHPSISALIGSYDASPDKPNFLSQYKNLLHHHVHQTAADEAHTFWSGCGAIHRAVIERLGGFDESYAKPSIEDIELGYRLRAAGYHVRLVKSLQVKHLKRWRATSLFRTDFFARAMPWSRLIKQQHVRTDHLNIDRHSRLSVICVAALILWIGAAPFWWPALVLAAAWALGLFALNVRTYLFFARARGAWFAARVVPCHWFYYFYSGLAYGIATCQYLLQRRDERAAQAKILPVESL